MKILLADDSITIQKVIGIIFGAEGYSLTVVDNGRAAVAKAREISPDVLLIDASMPGMSGYDVCEQVRATPELKTKPILLLTGSFEPFDEEIAKRCGADDFIAKPFESQQILAKVRELYELGASRAAAALKPAPEPAPVSFAAENPFQPSGISTPDDIWGAFTAPAEPAPATPAPEPAPPFASEPDVFALVNEEPVTQPWGSVTEQAFGFGSEPAGESPFGFSEPVQPLEDAFGDITFDETGGPCIEPAPEPSAPVVDRPGAQEDLAFGEFFFDEPTGEIPASSPSYEPVPPAPAEPAAHAASVASAAADAHPAVPLTEEQLKAALAGVSREVIERVVWEVVPDLAEVLIREAIRKIREGH